MSALPVQMASKALYSALMKSSIVMLRAARRGGMAAPRSMKSKISAESRNCPTVSVRWVTFGPACAIWRHREDHKSTRYSRGCYSLRGLEPACRNSGLPARSQPQRSSTATATLHPPQAIQTPELTLFRKKEEEGSGFRWRWTRQGREWRGKGNPERKPPKTCPCPCPWPRPLPPQTNHHPDSS
jgi:hypothetical protein